VRGEGSGVTGVRGGGHNGLERWARQRRPELYRPGLGAAALCANREGEGSEEGEGKGVLVPLLIGSRAQGAWPKVGCAAAVEAHGGHVPDARRSLRHSTEHMACVKPPDLETVSRPARVRIWIWANYESCSFRDALQLLFKDPDHWSNGLGGN
jgi:hypothetical protein